MLKKYKYSFDIRVGTIVNVKTVFSQKNYVLKVNFGSIIGLKNCYYRFYPNIPAHSLIGKHVCAIINFNTEMPNKKNSNILLLSMPNSRGLYVLIQPDSNIPNGGLLY
ncbi:putative chaperone CsaA [Commensalibacter sp. Nvir]|uniref:hypothetical protein n=1 Tax=Commensalibacter sp. Nvir TaxID=3069817 RepID=UPI002D4F9380|nr:putative chaperone CsaA [Commensalibacter sp. Nvir]